MSFPLYLDENVDPELAERLRAVGFDVETAEEASLAGRNVPDEIHLQHAAASGRVLLTHDLRTFPGVAQRHLDAGDSHAGLVLCRQQPIALLYRRVFLLFEQHDVPSLRNATVWLPPLQSE